MTAPKLSVVVLSWNTKDITLACLRALQRDTARHEREVLVIDNGSHDGSADAVASEHPWVQLVRNPDNRGYAGGHNQGARMARGTFLCTLNSDTEVAPGALDALVDFLEADPTYGAVAPMLVHPDGSVQRACMRFPGLLTALCYDTWVGKVWPGSWVEARYYMRDFDHLSSRDVAQPPGAVFVIRRQEYLDLGGLDENLFLFFNDVDLCRRLWKMRRRIRYLADVQVVHHGGASTKGYGDFIVVWHRNRLAYYRKHYGPWVMPYLRAIVRMRALQERFALRRRYRDPGDLRSALADLARCRREILAP
ncbi:MAG: glycosyltransferase family 2 protein [Planctomycetota bacterium]